MKIIYISYAIPPQELKEASTSRNIENKMACGVAEMLYVQYKENLKCISLQPRIKEDGYYKVAKRRKVILPCGIESQVLAGFTTPLLSIITGFWYLIKELNNEILQSEDEKIVLVTYNALPPISVAINFLLRKINIKKIAVLFDAPAIVLNSTPVKNLIIRAWNTVAKLFFNRYDGAIAVAPRCVTDFSSKMKHVQILMGTDSEYVTKYSTVKPSPIESDQDIIIGYAGSLEKHNGLILLIESMNFLPSNYKLIIMGNGKLENYVVERAKADVRIIYKGLVSPDEVLNEYKKCHILTIIRSGGNKVSDYLLKYGTSSKLSELMLTGKPVLTNRIEANPDEFYEFVNTVDSLSPENIAKEILEITKDKQVYAQSCMKSESGREFYKNNGTWEFQSSKVAEFLEKIMK